MGQTVEILLKSAHSGCAVASSVLPILLQNKNEKGFSFRSSDPVEGLNLWPVVLLSSRDLCKGGKRQTVPGLKPCKKHFYFYSCHVFVWKTPINWCHKVFTLQMTEDMAHHPSIHHSWHTDFSKLWSHWVWVHSCPFSKKPKPAIRKTEKLTGASLTFTVFAR